MKRNLTAYQSDLLQACQFIVEFVGELEEDEYTGNMLVKSAVERQFEVIGEVLGRMSREFPLAYAQIRNARQIIDLRNLIAHGYDVIDDSTIFGIVKVNIPELQSDIRGL
jgi:uncharacterized protein with HEPN domain